MANKEREIKALLVDLKKEDSNSPEARAIRRKLRALGYYLSKGGESKGKGKPEAKESKDEVKKGKKSKKLSKKEVEEDDDEDEEEEDSEE